MITKQKLAAIPLPKTPTRIKPKMDFCIQLQKKKIEDTPVQIYTAYKATEAGMMLYFRTFCWSGTFTTWVYDATASCDWQTAHAERARWSDAIIDKFIGREWHMYKNGKWCNCEKEEHFARHVDGAKYAEQLYQYQSKIRNDALVAKRRRVKLDTDAIMSQLKAIPKDIDAFVDNGPLLDSRYIYYKTTGKKKVKGKTVNAISGYCTHCKKDIEQMAPVAGQLHNAYGRCPCCKSKIQYKSTGKVSKYLQDDARFAVIQRITHGIIIRGFSVRREYHNHPKEPYTSYQEFFRVFLTFSGHLSYYHWGFVNNPGVDRWRREGNMQWRRYGANGLVFPTNACLYTKNLRHVLKGTPWEYSGIKE
ncbi:MAG: hypothetical protein ACK5JF_00775, partial [Oscillospiraceae bacterium]